jgi:hypothetical protein
MTITKKMTHPIYRLIACGLGSPMGFQDRQARIPATQRIPANPPNI